MNLGRSLAVVSSLVLAAFALGDTEHRRPTSIADIARLEGVKAEYMIEEGICTITIRLDHGNEFMGANSGTVAVLHLKDEAGKAVGSIGIRSKFDFPEGAILGPYKGGLHFLVLSGGVEAA